jgi:ABC-2 type transport system ATP-binding protein
VTPPPAIEVADLTVHYGKRVAVKELSLSLAAGEIVALLGPNGAGKSTALAAIAGAVLPSAGSIRIAGHDAAAAPLRARALTGFADQPPLLYEFYTVAEQLAFIAETRGARRPDDERTLLEALGLAAIADRLCRELSFGMRQRVGLAAALVGGARAVLLDETLNGLDPRVAKQARAVLEQAAAGGAAVLMSTHLLGVAERLCTRILIMDRGELRTDVSGSELAALVAAGPGAIEQLYLTHVEAGE